MGLENNKDLNKKGSESPNRNDDYGTDSEESARITKWIDSPISGLKEPYRKRLLYGYALITIAGFTGLYYFISVNIFGLLLDSESASEIALVGVQLLRLIAAIIFVIGINRRKDLYFMGNGLLRLSRSEFKALAIGATFITCFGILYTLYRFGKFYPMPPAEYPITIISALYFGIVEEIESRSALILFFGNLLVAKIKDTRKLNITVIALNTAIFGPYYHMRYFTTDPILLITVTIFGLCAGIIVIKYRSITVPWMLHAMLDFIPFIFMGGAAVTV